MGTVPKKLLVIGIDQAIPYLIHKFYDGEYFCEIN